MAGMPPANQPYGQQYQPMPQYAPPVARRPGSMAPKVWGILLLILGLMGLLTVLMNLASLGGGMSGSTFANVSPAAKTEIDRLTQDMVDASMARWSFWLYHAMEVVIVGVSIVAGIFLAMRPKPLGRKLAIARAILVFALIPVYGYETAQSMEGLTDMQDRMMSVTIDDNLAEREKRDPAKDDAERQRRRDEIKRATDVMQPIMKGAIFGTMIVVIVGMLIINALLVFFMTRPAVKEYLESVAVHGDHAIPNYDPSMGLATGPPQPPQQAPPMQ